MSIPGWTHGSALVAVALWAAAACGGEVRSESDMPSGGEAFVEPAGAGPTLRERPAFVISDLLHGPEAEERARRAREQSRAEEARAGETSPAEREATREAARVAPRPEPLPRYSTRPEAERPKPELRGSDPRGSVVEPPPEPDLRPADDRGQFPASRPEPLSIPVGVELELAVEAELSTERNRPGDLFYATLVDDVLAPDGLVLMAQGTRLRGIVTESRPSESADVPPVLELAIEAVLTGSTEQPVSAVVVTSELEVEARDSGGETAAKVITGAAAGAILGRVLGDSRRDAVKGGIAGAAAGAAVALGTRGGHARLKPGARIVIRLERRLIVAD